MTRRQKAPLRCLSEVEREYLEKMSRAQSAPAAQVTRAKLLLAVAAGFSYTDAARSVGRRSGDAVSRLVSRFNEQGLGALCPLHGGGPPVVYDQAKREQIVHTLQQAPDRLEDGTASWSLSTLQRKLRSSEPAFATISTYTLQKVLNECGWSWQKNRSWCATGEVMRKRKAGVVKVVDPDAEAKKF